MSTDTEETLAERFERLTGQEQPADLDDDTATAIADVHETAKLEAELREEFGDPAEIHEELMQAPDAPDGFDSEVAHREPASGRRQDDYVDDTGPLTDEQVSAIFDRLLNPEPRDLTPTHHYHYDVTMSGNTGEASETVDKVALAATTTVYIEGSEFQGDHFADAVAEVINTFGHQLGYGEITQFTVRLVQKHPLAEPVDAEKQRESILAGLSPESRARYEELRTGVNQSEAERAVGLGFDPDDDPALD